MPDRTSPSRRDLLLTASGLTAAALVPAAVAAAQAADADHGHGHAHRPDGKSAVVKNGKLNHSVCLWCYKGMKAADMAPVAKRLGLKAIDLLPPKDFPVLKEHGLVCSMTSHPDI